MNDPVDNELYDDPSSVLSNMDPKPKKPRKSKRKPLTDPPTDPTDPTDLAALASALAYANSPDTVVWPIPDDPTAAVQDYDPPPQRQLTPYQQMEITLSRCAATWKRAHRDVCLALEAMDIMQRQLQGLQRYLKLLAQQAQQSPPASPPEPRHRLTWRTLPRRR